MSRDDYAQQGKQFVNDLRDTVSKKVSDNEETILGTLGKAARWVDEKTGGKYSEQIGKAEAKVGEGVGWVGKQGTGEPRAPGAAAGDGTEPGTPGPGSGTPGTGTPGTGTPGTGTPGPRPSGSQAPGSATPTGTPDTTPPHAEGAPAGPGAAATGPATSEPPTGPVGPPTDPTGRERPTHPPRDDAVDWPRPPQQ
jgi:hypothetical protein